MVGRIDLRDLMGDGNDEGPPLALLLSRPEALLLV